MKTLTQAREFLATAIEDVLHDLQSDWISTEQKAQMQVQLQMLISAKGNLDAIAKSGQASQIFSSSILF